MKKALLYFIAGVLGVVTGIRADAQNFSVTADTVYCTYTRPTTYFDNITNNTTSTLSLKWHVSATDFPADWQIDTAFGICDAAQCRYNSSNQLWNSSTSTGSLYTTPYPGNAAHDSLGEMALTMNLSSAVSTGTYWMQVTIVDASTLPAYSKVITFVVNRQPTSVSKLSSVSSDVLLYPNPATNEINLVYDDALDVKNVAIYNIIGKVMSVYKVSGNSANISVDNMPSGIYFVRMVNGQGSVVATKRFTKQ